MTTCCDDRSTLLSGHTEFIFQGKHYQEYPIQSIENIEICMVRLNCYHPAVKLKNGKILRMTDNPVSKKDASQDIGIIREFLGFNF